MAAPRKARNETMKPDDIATAITQALVQGGSQWTVSTITAFLPVLWTMTLYYGPLVFAVEAASQSYLAGFAQFFTSNTNVTVALAIMWISMAGVVAVGAWLFVRAWISANRTMARRVEAQKTPPAKESIPAI